MVDGTGLENRHTRKGIGGSNPSLSARVPVRSSIFSTLEILTSRLSVPDSEQNSLVAVAIASMVYLLFAPARECGRFAFGSARPLANADHQMLKTGTGRLLPVYHLCRLFAKNVIDEVFDGSRGGTSVSP